MNQKIAQLEARNAKLETKLKARDEEAKAFWENQREQDAQIKAIEDMVYKRNRKRLGL